MKKSHTSDITRGLQPTGNYFGRPTETTFALGGGLRPKPTSYFDDEQENDDWNANGNEVKASPFV